MFVQIVSQLFEVGMRLWKVFAVGSLTLEKIWYSVGSESIDALVHPELHHVKHLGAYGRVIVVQVGLG